MKIEYDFKMSPLTAEDGGGFFAEVPAMPGCIAAGKTIEETLNVLQEAIESWKMGVEALGGAIPKPIFYQNEQLPSGRFSVRIPKTLHRDLIEISKKENESLNALVCYYLTQAVAGNLLESQVNEICQVAKQQITTKVDELHGVWKEVSFVPAFPRKPIIGSSKVESLLSRAG